MLKNRYGNMHTVFKKIAIVAGVMLLIGNCQSKSEKVQAYLDDIKSIQEKSIREARLNWSTNLTVSAAEQSSKLASTYQKEVESYLPKVEDVIPEHAKLIGYSIEWVSIFQRLQKNPQDKTALNRIPELEIAEASWEASVRALK